MSNLLDSLADEAADLTSAPSDTDTSRLRDAGMELIETDNLVQSLEDQLKDAKKKRTELAHKTLPDIMNELDTDTLGLASAGVDLELKPYCHASIPKTWTDEQRESAFSHIEDLGAGDIVRTIVTISAGKGDYDAMLALYNHIVDSVMSEYGVSASTNLELTVPWNTLTSFVKEQTEKGVAIDLERLGATVGQVVKIKKRKD